jgi:type II secretory pathway pseudopilin PulG
MKYVGKIIIKKWIKAISLLEVLLSLSIIAIILVMATRYFFVATNNDKINIIRQQIGSLVAAVNSWKNQNPQYTSDLTIAQLSSDGFLANSRSLSDDKSTLYDPWGDSITLTSIQGTGAQITVSLPNASDCNSLQNSYPDGTCSNTTFELLVR